MQIRLLSCVHFFAFQHKYTDDKPDSVICCASPDPLDFLSDSHWLFLGSVLVYRLGGGLLGSSAKNCLRSPQICDTERDKVLKPHQHVGLRYWTSRHSLRWVYDYVCLVVPLAKWKKEISHTIHKCFWHNLGDFGVLLMSKMCISANCVWIWDILVLVLFTLLVSWQSGSKGTCLTASSRPVSAS